MSFTAETKPAANTAVFLRESLATGETDDGTKIEMSLSGASMIMTIQRPAPPDAAWGTGRTVETLSVANLAQAWADSILKPKED